MTHTEVIPTTTVEAHRWIARHLVAPRHLVDAYAGEIERARADISSSQRGLGGAEYSVQVRGRHVEYEFRPACLTGRVSVADVLRVAGRAATRGAVERLTAALTAASALVREREERFAPTYWRTPRDVVPTPEYQDWDLRYAAAQREIRDAADAWWDGQPGTQLDLFGAAS